MSDDLDDFWVHTVQVATYAGQGSDGADTFQTAVPVQGFLDEKRTIVRTASGEEALSSSTLYAPISRAAAFTEKTRVTLPSGRTVDVLAVSPQTSGALDLPDHVVVSLV